MLQTLKAEEIMHNIAFQMQDHMPEIISTSLSDDVSLKTHLSQRWVVSGHWLLRVKEYDSMDASMKWNVIVSKNIKLTFILLGELADLVIGILQLLLQFWKNWSGSNKIIKSESKKTSSN